MDARMNILALDRWQEGMEYVSIGEKNEFRSVLLRSVTFLGRTLPVFWSDRALESGTAHFSNADQVAYNDAMNQKNCTTIYLTGFWLAGATLLPWARESSAAPLPMPSLGKKKELKRLKKPVDTYEDFGPTDIAPISRADADMGVGVHREQEGVDHPYVVEFGLSSTLAFVRKETKGTGAQPVQDRRGDLEGEITMFFGALQVGTAFGYNYSLSTTQLPVTGVDEAREAGTQRSEVGGYAVGPVFKYNFKNINRALLVPFVLCGASYTEALTTSTGLQSSSRRGYALRGGTGLHMFLSSHVAFTPRLEYHFAKTQGKSGETGEERISAFRALFQLAFFI